MLMIKDIKWPHGKYILMNELCNTLDSSLKKLNLSFKIKLEGDQILFLDIDRSQTFASSKNNKIMLNETDARRAKLGRDHLLSKRPSKRQYEGFFNTIQKIFDDLALMATINLIVSKTNKTYCLREGVFKINRYPELKSFPIEGE